MTAGRAVVVGVVVAMPSEARAFTGSAAAVRSLVRFSEEGVLLYVGGVGGDRARAAADRLLGSGARALVSFGTAGGLEPSLAPGTVLVPERVVAAGGARFATDEAWAGRIRGRLRCASGAIAESPRVLGSPLEKRDLFLATSARGVDMESAAVAAAALQAGVPFVAVRAICDAASLAIPPAALRAVDPFGRLRPTRLLAALVRSPGEIAGLLSLSSAAAAAHAALRAVVRTLGRRLVGPS